MARTHGFAEFIKDIKLTHTIFALPFALSALLFIKSYSFDLGQLVYILICMVCARTFAMGMNRFLDHPIDKMNPRTAGRAIPGGRISPTQTLAWSVAAGVLFIIAASRLSSLAGKLSLPLLAVLAMYSLMKRVTWATHFYLGLCLGLAPVAVNVVIAQDVSSAVLLLGAAVMFWTAGFDILYALHDQGFDREHHLNSIPAHFGAQQALWISRICHVLTVVALLVAGRLADKGMIFFLGLGILAGILLYEQWIVRGAGCGQGLEKINFAFFNLNGYVSILFFCFTQIDFWLKRSM